MDVATWRSDGAELSVVGGSQGAICGAEDGLGFEWAG